jgi:ribosomal protein S8
MDALPVYAVSKPGFIQLMDTAFKSRYNLPSRNYFTDTAIPKLYNETKAGILNAIKGIINFAATTDIWSSIGLYPYISLTLHYITDDWRLQTHVLETYPMPEDHTGQNISEVIEDMLELWNISKSQLIAITTDNAANMKLAGTKLDITRVSCFGHILHNAINFALSSNEEVEKAISECKKMSGKVSSSWKKRRELARIQRDLNLPILTMPTECSTRWNSKHKLVTYVLEQERALRDLFNDRSTQHLLPSEARFQVSQLSYWLNLRHFIQCDETILFIICIVLLN